MTPVIWVCLIYVWLLSGMASIKIYEAKLGSLDELKRPFNYLMETIWLMAGLVTLSVILIILIMGAECKENK